MLHSALLLFLHKQMSSFLLDKDYKFSLESRGAELTAVATNPCKSGALRLLSADLTAPESVPILSFLPAAKVKELQRQEIQNRKSKCWEHSAGQAVSMERETDVMFQNEAFSIFIAATGSICQYVRP